MNQNTGYNPYSGSTNMNQNMNQNTNKNTSTNITTHTHPNMNMNKGTNNNYNTNNFNGNYPSNNNYSQPGFDPFGTNNLNNLVFGMHNDIMKNTMQMHNNIGTGFNIGFGMPTVTTGVNIGFGFKGIPGCHKCYGTGYKKSKKKFSKMKPCKLCMIALGKCPKCNNTGFKIGKNKRCKCVTKWKIKFR